MATKAGIAKMFALLRGAYPDQLRKQLEGFDMSKGIDDATVQMMRFYMPYFQDIPDDIVVAATINRTAKDNPWWPRVGELRAEAFDLMLGQNGMPTALEAWGTVVAYMRQPQSVYRDGRSIKLAPLPDLIEQTVRDTGGWRMLRNSENVVADRARFVEAYKTRAARALNSKRMLPQVREAAERFQIEAQETAQIESG